MNWYYQVKTGLQMGRFWKEVSKLFIIPLFMCVITLYLSKYVNFYSIPTFIIGVVVYSLIYCIINWFVVMNDYEKSIFIVPLNRITNKLKGKKNDSSN